jgi:hypothetical protein
MCGRIVQTISSEEIAREFGADLTFAAQESIAMDTLVPSAIAFFA